MGALHKQASSESQSAAASQWGHNYTGHNYTGHNYIGHNLSMLRKQQERKKLGRSGLCCSLCTSICCHTSSRCCHTSNKAGNLRIGAIIRRQNIVRPVFAGTLLTYGMECSQGPEPGREHEMCHDAATGPELTSSCGRSASAMRCRARETCF